MFPAFFIKDIYWNMPNIVHIWYCCAIAKTPYNFQLTKKWHKSLETEVALVYIFPFFFIFHLTSRKRSIKLIAFLFSIIMPFSDTRDPHNIHEIYEHARNFPRECEPVWISIDKHGLLLTVPLRHLIEKLRLTGPLAETHSLDR